MVLTWSVRGQHWPVQIHIAKQLADNLRTVPTGVVLIYKISGIGGKQPADLGIGFKAGCPVVNTWTRKYCWRIMLELTPYFCLAMSSLSDLGWSDNVITNWDSCNSYMIPVDEVPRVSAGRLVIGIWIGQKLASTRLCNNQSHNHILTTIQQCSCRLLAAGNSVKQRRT